MKTIARLLSCTMLALTFVFSTMLQYHHHDAAGNIFIYLAGRGEIELSNHCHPHGHTCCHSHTGHHHDDHDAGCHSNNIPQQGDCAMHLDETIVIDDHQNNTIIKAPAFSIIEALMPVVFLFDFTPNVFLSAKKICHISCLHTEATGFFKSISHRGPPFLA